MAKSKQPKLPSRSHQQVIAEQERLADEARRQQLIKWVGIAAGVLILLSIIIGSIYAATRPSADIPLNGQVLAEYDSNSDTDQAIRSKAPIFQAPDETGTVQLFGGGGAPRDSQKVIMLVNEDCDGCEADFAAVDEWTQAEGVPEGVELIAIVTGSPSDGAADWLADQGWDHSAFIDDKVNTMAEAFGFDLDDDETAWLVMNNNNIVRYRRIQTADVNYVQQLALLAADG